MPHTLTYGPNQFWPGVPCWHVDGKPLEFRAFPPAFPESTADLDDVRTGWVKTIMVGVEFECAWRPGYSDIWPIIFPGVPLPRGDKQAWSQTP